jgi:hypothetical protein
MLCPFCSSLDLDQLSSNTGYKHPSSVSDLLESAHNGCESCELILKGQWVEVGGDLHLDSDRGPLETQIIARGISHKPGGYNCIRYGQEARSHIGSQQTRERNSSFLWTFLNLTTRDGMHNPLLFVYVLSPADDPAAIIIRPRILDNRTLEHQISLASHWLEECLSSHSQCLPEGQGICDTPTRVIDVGPPDGSCIPFLHTSNGNIHEWVALSHRWGNNQPFQTNEANLVAHQSALPWDALPRLFQDAILITRRMGYQYLWIDSLCIVQDSPEDWRQEMTRMGSIYKYCVFLIAADCCYDSSESIFERSLIGKSVESVQLQFHSAQRGLRGTEVRVWQKYGKEKLTRYNPELGCSKKWSFLLAL